MRDRVLVIGLSGTGKSYLARYFRGRGRNAFDADEVPDLSVWTDEQGNPKEITKEEWLSQEGIRFAWNTKRLVELLEQNEQVYLFGSASNSYDFISLFDRRYYLQASEELISERLRHPSRDNDFGQDPKQRDMILGGLADAEDRARKAGFRFIHASLSPQTIFEIIIGPPEIGKFSKDDALEG